MVPPLCIRASTSNDRWLDDLSDMVRWFRGVRGLNVTVYGCAGTSVGNSFSMKQVLPESESLQPVVTNTIIIIIIIIIIIMIIMIIM